MRVCSEGLRPRPAPHTCRPEGGDKLVRLEPIKRWFRILEKHLTFIYCGNFRHGQPGRISSDPWKQGKAAARQQPQIQFAVLLGSISEIDFISLRKLSESLKDPADNITDWISLFGKQTKNLKVFFNIKL